MDSLSPVARAFAAEVSHEDAAIDLGRAALTLACFRYPQLNIERELLRLDALADQVRVALGGNSIDAAAIARTLFLEMGFRGNSANYTEDANSFLNDVLDRRLGIPISLSVLHIEVARRLGLRVQPVGMPGHFLTTALHKDNHVYFDCFNGGAMLYERDCALLLANITAGAHTFNKVMLAPVDKRHVLRRMLNNLKGIYVQGKLWSMLAGVLELMLVIDPDDASEQRNLGVALVNCGQYRRGLDVLSGWLERNPNAPEAQTMRQYAIELAERVSRWN